MWGPSPLARRSSATPPPHVLHHQLLAVQLAVANLAAGLGQEDVVERGPAQANGLQAQWERAHEVGQERLARRDVEPDGAVLLDRLDPVAAAHLAGGRRV